MDGVANIAANMGGWTVSSDRSDDFSGRIAVRVPAERLDEAIVQVRGVAVDIESEITTSKDVTDEYFDAEARLKNQRTTETALLNLLEQALRVEDALAIQKTLTEVQEEIERLLGTLKLLEETSAFSLMNVAMRVEKVDLAVDAGPDLTVNVGETVRFKASFRAPDDFSDYNVIWNFGDRAAPFFDNFTAPTSEAGTRVTASVTHVFDDHRDSPYFVDVKITGPSATSPLGGQDTIKVTVVDTEQMPVDAGKDQTVAVDRNMRFRALFEPPAGIDDFTFTWDFGDGTQLVAGNRVVLTEDSDRMVTAVANHVFSTAEESPYIVQIEMTGRGEAGAVEGTDKVVVTVTEVPVIDVFAGEGITVEESAESQFRGTFTRPEGVTNMRYRWTFGDGSTPDTGSLEDGNAVEVRHAYVLHRSTPYTATLTVTGDSEAGTVKASSVVQVSVTEGKSWVVGGIDIEGNGKDAVRSLSVITNGLVTMGIWVLVFSPLWGGGLAIVLILSRVSSRGRQRRRSSESTAPQERPLLQENLDA